MPRSRAPYTANLMLDEPPLIARTVSIIPLGAVAPRPAHVDDGLCVFQNSAQMICGSGRPSPRHESESRIDGIVDDRQVQPVALGNALPVVNAGAAERIDLQANTGAANRLHVDDRAEIARVGAEVIMLMRRGGAKRFLERNPDDDRKVVVRSATDTTCRYGRRYVQTRRLRSMPRCSLSRAPQSLD